LQSPLSLSVLVLLSSIAVFLRWCNCGRPAVFPLPLPQGSKKQGQHLAALPLLFCIVFSFFRDVSPEPPSKH